jgi:hypothetical protein
MMRIVGFGQLAFFSAVFVKEDEVLSQRVERLGIPLVTPQ